MDHTCHFAGKLEINPKDQGAFMCKVFQKACQVMNILDLEHYYCRRFKNLLRRYYCRSYYSEFRNNLKEKHLDIDFFQSFLALVFCV